MRKLLLILFIGMALVSMVSAANPCGNDNYFLDFVEKSSTISLYQRCSNCTYVNITQIKYPNGSISTINEAMTKNDVDYNYTFTKTQDLDCYSYTIKGDKNGIISTETIDFKVTPSGQDFDEGQAIGGLGIFLGLIAVAFTFLFIGAKLGKEDKTAPFGFFFIVLAVIVAIGTLYMGWAFSVDLLQHEIISKGVSRIFTTILWTVSGITIIFFALMLIAFIRELGRINKTKKFGQDFNPLTDTYE